MKSTIHICLIMIAVLITLDLSAQQPNIVVLMTDDQTLYSMGCEGHPQVLTPNLDALAKSGLQFRNHYSTTAICMASRATMMTGMLEYKTGCNFMHGPLSTDKFKKSYPEMLQAAGYRTGFAGKLGFSVDDSGRWKDNDYARLPVDEFDSWAGGKGQTNYVTAKNEYLARYADEFPHSTLAYGAYGRDFIRESVQEEKPFCLTVFFKAPHGPLTPDPAFDKVYKYIDFVPPLNYGREKGTHLAKQSKLGRQYLRYFNENNYPEVYLKNMQLYHQLVHGVDRAVGMIIEELEKQGIAENTIIIYTADNGLNLGAHGLGGKVLPYEEGTRIPLMIYDPRGGNAGTALQSFSLTGNIDIMPTVLDYAGLDIPDNVDGKSLVPLVENPGQTVRRVLPLIQAWGSHTTFAFTVVTDQWKYIYWYFADNMDPSEELFHVEKDPFEMKNLVNDSLHASVLKEMRELYDTEVKRWEEESVPVANYPVYAKLFNRHIPWEEKEVLVPQAHREYYLGVLKSIGYKGSPYDYDTIIKSVQHYNPDK